MDPTSSSYLKNTELTVELMVSVVLCICSMCNVSVSVCMYMNVCMHVCVCEYLVCKQKIYSSPNNVEISNAYIITISTHRDKLSCI